MGYSCYQNTQNSLAGFAEVSASMLKDSVGLCSYQLDEIIRLAGLGNFLANRFVDGGLIPMLKSAEEIKKDLTDLSLNCLSGKQSFPESVEEVSQKIYSGLDYETKILKFGKALFGSAKYEGEELLAENDILKLSFLPAVKSGSKKPKALFHVGGFLPYSDRIFRFLPEANFFQRFLERGMNIYAVELKGSSRFLKNIKLFTLGRFFEMLDEMSDTAFLHNGKEKMAIEGYCGLAMPMLSYLSAFCSKADKKFSDAFTMVAPVDGTRCTSLANMLGNMPQSLLKSHFALSEIFGGTVSGSHLRAGMDIPIKGFFSKTALGRFLSGWKQKELAQIKSIEDLTSNQRKELAGAYWISPQNCDLYPMPVDLVKFSSALFLNGIKPDGDIPYEHQGKALNFKTILKNTQIKIAGFYGGQDNLVPDNTGRVLNEIFAERYTHIVHQQAGHISYVLSPKLWQKGTEHSLVPNPVDVVLG